MIDNILSRHLLIVNRTEMFPVALRFFLKFCLRRVDDRGKLDIISQYAGDSLPQCLKILHGVTASRFIYPVNTP